MCVALSIVPKVGRGIAIVTPGPFWYHLQGKFPVPLSVVHPRDNAKGRRSESKLCCGNLAVNMQYLHFQEHDIGHLFL